MHQPTIRADFLCYYKLILDMPHGRTLAPETSLAIQGMSSCASPLRLFQANKTIPCPWSSDIAEFPDVFRPRSFQSSVAHSIRDISHCHGGPSCICHSRRLAPDRPAVTKKEFEHVRDLGVISPSFSRWASPLRMVHKCLLIAALAVLSTLCTSYYPGALSNSHIEDFLSALHAAPFFNEIEFCKGYHEVPVEPAGTSKAAIITPFGLFKSLCIPLGLRNAAQTFQDFTDQVLRSFTCISDYLDTSSPSVALLKLTSSICIKCSRE